MADEAKETDNFEVVTTEAVDQDKPEQHAGESNDQEQQGKESAKAQEDDKDEEQETDDNKEDADNAGDAGAEDKPKKSGRFQKRIDRLTKRASEAERRAAEAEARLREFEGKGDKGSDAGSDDEPDPGDYESYNDYLDALADWKSEQKGKTADDKPREKAKDKEPESDPEFDDAVAEVTEAFNDTRNKYKDFNEVISQQDLTITKDMVKALAETDDPGEVAYYLGKHKDEATRIAALPPLAQAKEIGKLEARLQQKPGKKLPSAPDPIEPVKGGDSKQKTAYEADDFSEFERLRNEQEQKRGSGW